MNESSPDSASEEPTRSRYPGTRPFRDSPEDETRFYGRDAEGEQLYLRVLSVSLLLQFATSGLGKTSLLQASLFPRLRKNKPFLPVMVRLDATEESLVDAVARSFEQACKSEGLKFPEVRKDGLWELLSTALVWRGDLLLTPVLVFDQFEEVFTLRDRAFRDNLAEELGALATGVPPERLQSRQTGAPERFKAQPDVKIVISLREDYLGALEEFSPAIPNLFHERLRLEPLVEDEARKAITKPAQLVAREGEEPFWAPRFDFGKGALDKIIVYLKGESGVIEPFTLQLLCRHAEAIAHRKSEKGEGSGEKREGLVCLTLADFNEGKDFEQVLKNLYKDILVNIEEKLGKSARSNAEEMCEHGLLDREGRRLLLEEAQIYDQFRVDAETLRVLGQERLIRREPRLESTFYEISHDRLAESIYASRRNKLPKKEQEQRQKEREQLHKEQSLREQQQQLIHRLKRFAVFLSALCLVLAVAIVVAGWSYRVAGLARADAETQRALADDRRKKAEDAEDYAKNQQRLAEAAKLEEEAQRNTAETKKKEADRLLGFTLGEKFLGEIRDAGRTSTLEQVRKETESQEDMSGLVRGLALRNVGDIERTEGNLKKSLDYFGKALDVIEHSAEFPDRGREAARTHARIADASGDPGQVSESLFHSTEAVKAWREVLKAPSEDATNVVEDCASLAVAIASFGGLKIRMGEPERANSDWDEGLEIVSAMLFGAQSSRHPECILQAQKLEPHPNAKALKALIEILAARADTSTFVSDNNPAAALARELRRLTPPSTVARWDAFETLVRRARGRTGLRALEDYRAALAETDEMRRWDPENKLWQRERAALQLLMGAEIANCNSASSNVCSCPAEKTKTCNPAPSLQEAEGMSLEAIATMRALDHSDASNLTWKSDLGWGLQTYAQVLAVGSQSRNSERLKALEEFEQIYISLERDDDPTSVEQTAALLEVEADAYVSSGELDKAKAAVKSAEDRIEKLFAAHPNNEAFTSDLSEAFGREASILKEIDRVGAGAAMKKQQQLDQSNAKSQANLQKAAERLVDEFQ